MRLEQGTFCPLVKGKCKMLECSWFTQVRGTDPQTGKEVDEFQCAVKWLPMLILEVAKETRQGAAATESFRNEVVRRTDAANGPRPAQIEGRQPRPHPSYQEVRGPNQPDLFRDSGFEDAR